MKAPVHRTIALALAVAASFGGASVANAQQIQGSLQRGVPTRDTPRLMVAVFRSDNPELSVDAADAVRDRMQRDFNGRQLFIVTKGDVVKTLEQSGYPVDEALSANDAQALARIVRADQYVEGSVQPSASGGVSVTARLVLARDNKLVQPLGTFEASKVSDAASQISREVREARKQLESEQRCVNNYRDSNFEQAAAEARKGKEEYGRATIARVCEVRAMSQLDAAPDELLALTSEILEIHPQNQPALTIAYEAYKAKGDEENALSALTTLLSVDPSNVTLQNAVVAELAASRRFETAVPIIDRALAENPADPQLLNTAFKVYLASENYEKATAAGERLIPLDTLTTDSTFYVGLARAYASDSQPQKAAEAAARGTQRYPNNATLWTVAAQFYRSSGQLDQASDALSRAAQIDPNTSGLGLLQAQLFVDRNQLDSAAVALRRAGATDTATAAQLALAYGTQRIQAAQAAAEVDSLAASEWKLAEEFLALSDELAPSDQAKFLRGLSAFQFVAKSYTEVAESRSCEGAQELQNYTRIAQTEIPAGGRANPESAAQLMGAIPQIRDVVGRLVSTHCGN